MKGRIRVASMVLLLSGLVFLAFGSQLLTAFGDVGVSIKDSQALDVNPSSSTQNATVITNQQYIEYTPINIRNNADFKTHGFPGEGTQENPYLIEGLKIANAFETLISIQYTTVYFCIQNNYLDGLTLDGFRNGIDLKEVIHGTIDANIVTNCHQGIDIYGSSEITIANNKFYHNDYGIYIWESQNNTVVHNTILHCRYGGIGIYYTEYTIVAHNIVNDSLSGIAIDHYQQNIVIYNSISYCDTGVEIGINYDTIVAHNTVTHCSYGIHFFNGKNTTLHNNTITGNKEGIRLEGACNIIIINNSIVNNIDYGMTISDFIYSGLHAAYIEKSEDNIIRENDFVGNNMGGTQAWDAGIKSVFTHNYWDDHENTDRNADGIADTPYIIEGDATNQDFTPQATFINPHRITISSITYPNGGETLQGITMLQWVPAIDMWGHSVTYTVSYSIDNGSTWTPLALELSSPTYEWDTTTVVDGSSYRIRVVATCVEGLSIEDLSDATFTIRNSAHSLSAPTMLTPNG